ncbi:MAG: methylglyoxal synthase [Bacteroidota bacterium]
MKKMALVAHDHKKSTLLAWTSKHLSQVHQFEIFATGTTGTLLEKELGLSVHKFMSGPLGGDQQIGAKVVEGSLDMLFFFWDPLAPMPHDPDVKALLRLAVLWNVPTACNQATADLLITSTLLPDYQPERPKVEERLHTFKT